MTTVQFAQHQTLNALVQQVFRAQPGPQPPHWRNVLPGRSPARVLSRLRHSIFRDLPLEPGASLSYPETDEDTDFPDLGIYAANDALTATTLQFWSWKRREATREISIHFQYHGGRASVRVAARADCEGTSVMERVVWASEYLNHPGRYEGHNQLYQQAVPDLKMRQFVHLVAELMD